MLYGPYTYWSVKNPTRASVVLFPLTFKKMDKLTGIRMLGIFTFQSRIYAVRKFRGGNLPDVRFSQTIEQRNIPCFLALLSSWMWILMKISGMRSLPSIIACLTGTSSLCDTSQFIILTSVNILPSCSGINSIILQEWKIMEFSL